MSVKMTEGEFRGLGLATDPDDPSMAIQVASIEGILPDDNWDLDRLATYASSGLAEAARLDNEAIHIGRRSTVQIYRSGMALSIARRRLKAQGRGCWGGWLESHKIKRTTAWEAAELFKRAGSEAVVEKLTPSEAKSKFGITSPPREDLKPPGKHPHIKPSGTPSEDDLDEGGRGEADDEDLGEADGEERGGDLADADGEDQRSLGPDRPECEALVCPPRSVREVLVAVCNLLLECERRRGEIDVVGIPLVAEILEIASRLRTETPS